MLHCACFLICLFFTFCRVTSYWTEDVPDNTDKVYTCGPTNYFDWDEQNAGNYPEFCSTCISHD